MRRIATLLVSTLALAIVGCSLQQPPTQPRYHRIPPLADSGGIVAMAGLALGEIQAAPPADGQFFTYRTGATEFTPDFHHRFSPPPADQIHHILSRIFADPGAPGNPKLTGTLLAIHGDFQNPQRPLACLSLELRIEGSDGNIHFQRRFDQAVPIPAATPDALIRGWQDALKNILKELAASPS